MSASTAENQDAEGATAPAQLFVINLCASTSPMALTPPDSPELKRYTFFVSRQREDGRERFRLHMGYFAAQEDAEQLLAAVRDVYPAAWAGPAPTSGVPRRNRVVVAPVAAVVKSVPPPAVAANPAPAPVVAAKPPPAIAPASAAAPPTLLPNVLDTMSNVRVVLDQLSEEPPTRAVQANEPERSNLSESEVLRVLEASAKSVAEPVVQAPIRIVTPQDTQTLADIKSDAESNSPPCFAVQLVWSVSPIDSARLPHLAIFDAYNLYNVEGSRHGRKWYGVRLGFFSDPASATQVANYVRSDYRAVAIVPVSVKERDGAGGGKQKKPNRRGTDAGKAARPEFGSENLDGFQLLNDDIPPPVKVDIDDQPTAGGVAVPVARPVPTRDPGKSPAKPTGKRVVARKRPGQPTRKRSPGAADPLESTLEILGASTLSLEDGRETINDSAVREPLERKSSNRFSRLLSRLSGN